MCLAAEYQSRGTPLSAAEIKRLNTGELRKMHPTEQLAAFSYEPHEYPQLKGQLSDQYKAVAQTICLNAFEAFTAEALAAMGNLAVREKLYAHIDALQPTTPRVGERDGERGGERGGCNASGCGASESNGKDTELPAWLEARISKHGVPFYRYAPLREDDESEDELCQYERQNLANIAANRKKLEELGLL